MFNMRFGNQLTLMQNLMTSAGLLTPIRDRCTCKWARTDSRRLPWDANYGGWGGAGYFDTQSGVSHTPIVFIHGNGRDACDWKVAAGYFLDQGYTGDELWAITFEEETPTHREIAAQTEDFIAHVRDHTGVDEVVIVAHSLGVTGTRYWLAKYGRDNWVDTFIALAGANHGIPVCEWPITSFLDRRHRKIAEFLTDGRRASTDMTLSDLNADETSGDIEYYTIRGKYDSWYYARPDSPELEGATENAILQTDHDGVRESADALRLIDTWTN